MTRTALVVTLMLLGGCISDSRASRDRGASGIFENVPTYRAPEADRCQKLPAQSFAQSSCLEAKTLAQTYVRRLSSGDTVCLEGGFGENPGAACLARAAVVDSAANRVLIEIREGKPESKWFNREQHQFWFEEGALVDLYLAEHGY